MCQVLPESEKQALTQKQKGHQNEGTVEMHLLFLTKDIRSACLLGFFKMLHNDIPCFEWETANEIFVRLLTVTQREEMKMANWW